MNNYREIARKMMETESWDELPQSLRATIDLAAARVRACGGYLRSRQAIACLIAQWEEAVSIREMVE